MGCFFVVKTFSRGEYEQYSCGRCCTLQQTAVLAMWAVRPLVEHDVDLFGDVASLVSCCALFPIDPSLRPSSPTPFFFLTTTQAAASAGHLCQEQEPQQNASQPPQAQEHVVFSVGDVSNDSDVVLTTN